jgi:hypothetical protein
MFLSYHWCFFNKSERRMVILLRPTPLGFLAATVWLHTVGNRYETSPIPPGIRLYSLTYHPHS